MDFIRLYQNRKSLETRSFFQVYPPWSLPFHVHVAVRGCVQSGIHGHSSDCRGRPGRRAGTGCRISLLNTATGISRNVPI